MTPGTVSPTRAHSAMRRLVAYLRIGWRSALAFRASLFAGIAGLAVQIVLVVTVWRAVYGERPSVQGVPAGEAIGYASLATCLAAVMLPFRFSSVPERVRTGVIAVDVIRPVGVVSQWLAINAGTSLAALPLAFAGALAAAVLGALRPPESPVHALLFVVSSLLGWAIAMMANLAVSMTAFWTLETRGVFHIYRTVAAFCSGALVPLWFMPDQLRTALAWLPFQAQVFTPLSVYFGTRHGDQLWQALAAQLGWVTVMYGLLRLATWRALRKVVVQGG